MLQSHLLPCWGAGFSNWPLFIVRKLKILRNCIQKVRWDTPLLPWWSLQTTEGWRPLQGRTRLWQKSRRGFCWLRAVAGRRATAAASRHCCLAIWTGSPGISSSLWFCGWPRYTFETFITLLLRVIPHNGNIENYVNLPLHSQSLSAFWNYFLTRPDFHSSLQSAIVGYVLRRLKKLVVLTAMPRRKSLQQVCINQHLATLGSSYNGLFLGRGG